MARSWWLPATRDHSRPRYITRRYIHGCLQRPFWLWKIRNRHSGISRHGWIKPSHSLDPKREFQRCLGKPPLGGSSVIRFAPYGLISQLSGASPVAPKSQDYLQVTVATLPSSPLILYHILTDCLPPVENHQHHQSCPLSLAAQWYTASSTVSIRQFKNHPWLGNASATPNGPAPLVDLILRGSFQISAHLRVSFGPGTDTPVRPYHGVRSSRCLRSDRTLNQLRV